MRARHYLLLLILAVLLAAVVAYQGVVAGAGEEAATEGSPEAPLEEAIVGIWKFPVEGYYMGFDEAGNLCYGGSEESVAAKRYCNAYTVKDGVVTETCMGGPEDRNCPLGGGACKARVSVSADGEFDYRILRGQCDMLAYKAVPPRRYTFSRDFD